MSKHKGLDSILRRLEFEERAEKLRQEIDAERKLHEELQILTPAEQVLDWNRRRVRKSASDRAILRTVTCQMPKCDRDVIRLAGDSLGICYQHAAAIEDYFNIIGEDFQNKLARVDRIERVAKEQEMEARAAESRRHHPGWIYYILVGDRIKIGYSTDPKRRFRSYPPDSLLLAMHPGTKQLESEMHAKFAGSRAAGREWFLDTPELRDHIKDVLGQFGEPDRARYEHRGQHKIGNLKAS